MKIHIQIPSNLDLVILRFTMQFHRHKFKKDLTNSQCDSAKNVVVGIPMLESCFVVSGSTTGSTTRSAASARMVVMRWMAESFSTLDYAMCGPLEVGLCSWGRIVAITVSEHYEPPVEIPLLASEPQSQGPLTAGVVSDGDGGKKGRS